MAQYLVNHAMGVSTTSTVVVYLANRMEPVRIAAPDREDDGLLGSLAARIADSAGAVLYLPDSREMIPYHSVHSIELV